MQKKMQQSHSEPTIVLRDEERTRCEVWTRVMGYHRPVSAFNRGKQAEHQERVYFQEQVTGRPAQPSMRQSEQAQREAA
jgi:hypothetical protein